MKTESIERPLFATAGSSEPRRSRQGLATNSRTMWSLEEVLSRGDGSGKALRWPVPEFLGSSELADYHNNFIRELSKKSVPDALEAYVYFSVEEMEKLLSLASRFVLQEPLSGVGVDLGGGTGLLASVVAKSSSVQRVIAVEVAESAADLLIPKVASWVLGKQAEKVIPVVGTFNDLRLPSDSIDFAVEIDSFHHSDNLELTFSECARVLKPGGWLLCFDRVWGNKHPEADLERLRNIVYSREFLMARGYPPDLVLTRREFGEHEYRRCEWQAGIDAAGLELLKLCLFYEKISFRKAVKGLLSILPDQIRHKVYQTDNANLVTVLEWMKQQTRMVTRHFTLGFDPAAPEKWPQKSMFAPRVTTAFLMRKPLR